MGHPDRLCLYGWSHSLLQGSQCALFHFRLYVVGVTEWKQIEVITSAFSRNAREKWLCIFTRWEEKWSVLTSIVFSYKSVLFFVQVWWRVQTCKRSRRLLKILKLTNVIFEDMHNSWLYRFTIPLQLRDAKAKHVSLSSRGIMKQYNQELCISSNSRCFTKSFIWDH